MNPAHTDTLTPEEREEMERMVVHSMLNQTASVGRKFDAGKLDYTLVPWDGLEEVVKVLEFGARKYARDNWKHVEGGEQRYQAAAFRHLIAYNQGETVDQETGLSHLAHAGCCLLFLLSLEKQNG
ncbi:MAG: dATP/dGTP diphosphohydrolase domain-containing protein [Pseudomonadota bacterium]